MVLNRALPPSYQIEIIAFQGETAHPAIITITAGVPGGIIPILDGDPYNPRRPTVVSLMADSLISVGDTLDFTASASVGTGTLKNYSWDFNGDGLTDQQGSLSDPSGSIKGSHSFPVAGDFQVVLTVRSEFDFTAQAQMLVHVKQDVPVAYAGKDTTVYTGTTAFLHGVESDTLGRIVSRQWKIGDGVFSEGPLEQEFIAPSVPGPVLCLLRVTDDDGQSDTDTVIVHVVSAAESFLTSLELSHGTLRPQFDPQLYLYADTVPNAIEAVSMTVSGLGVLTVNGVSLVAEKPSPALDLKIGDNLFSVKVEVDGSEAKTYEVNVVRLGISANNDLTGLSVSSGRLSPDFSADDTLYSVLLPYSVTSIRVTATASASTSSIQVQGKTVSSGTASDAIELGEGENSVEVAVSAQSGTVKTYTIQFTRAAGASPLLSDLSLSAGTLDSAFSSADTLYRVSVANGITQTTITPTSAASTSTVTVDGVAVPSGTASVPIGLEVGTNRISIVVTSESGLRRTYLLEVVRPPNDDATLSGMTLYGGNLDSPFAPDDTLYSVRVDHEMDSIRIIPVRSHATATVNYQGVSLAPGESVGPVYLEFGVNEFVISVIAESGAVRKYRVLVTREENGNAYLRYFKTSVRSLDAELTFEDTLQTLLVGAEIDSVWVEPQADDPAATITVNGTPLASGSPTFHLKLATGPNLITVVVTAENGAQRTYVLTVSKTASNDATLSDLSITATGPGGTEELLLSPDFSPETLAYDVCRNAGSVSIKVNPTTNNDGATVKVNGVSVASGTESGAIDLSSVGATLVTLALTAEDGSTTQSYTIRVALPAETGFIATVFGEMLQTFNGGASWISLSKPPDLTVIRSVHFLNGKTGFAAGGSNQLYRTTDGGRNWILRTSEVSNSNLDQVTFTSSTTGYAVGGSSVPGGPATILKTVNGGTDWQETTIPGGGALRSVHFPTSSTGYAVGIGGDGNQTWASLVKTDDAGANWTLLPSPSINPLNTVFFTDANTGYAAGGAGIYLKTVDAGESWVSQSTGAPEYLESIYFVNANVGYVVGYGGFIGKTTNGGSTWVAQTSGTTVTLQSVYFTDANTGYAGGLNGVLLTTKNGGNTWTSVDGITDDWIESIQFLK